RRPSRCWSIAGRYRCATPSSGLTARRWSTPGSIPATWWQSGSKRRGRPTPPARTRPATPRPAGPGRGRCDRMIRRRRPLRRAAMVAGVGYASYQAGKHVEARAQHEYDQDAQLAELQRQAPGAPATPSADERYQTLAKLKALLDSGALTQEEY